MLLFSWLYMFGAYRVVKNRLLRDIKPSEMADTMRADFSRFSRFFFCSGVSGSYSFAFSSSVAMIES